MPLVETLRAVVPEEARFLPKPLKKSMTVGRVTPSPRRKSAGYRGRRRQCQQTNRGSVVGQLRSRQSRVKSPFAKLSPLFERTSQIGGILTSPDGKSISIVPDGIRSKDSALPDPESPWTYSLFFVLRIECRNRLSIRPDSTR